MREREKEERERPPLFLSPSGRHRRQCDHSRRISRIGWRFARRHLGNWWRPCYRLEPKLMLSNLKMITIVHGIVVWTWWLMSGYKKKITPTSNLKIITTVHGIVVWAWWLMWGYKKKVTPTSNLKMIHNCARNCSVDMMINPTSCRNSKPTGSSQNRHVKNIAFGPPSTASIGRPNDNLGTNGVLRNLLSYSVTNSNMCSTIILLRTH